MNKEIIIDGEESDWFEKATFILKPSMRFPKNKNLFLYAEELVESSLKNTTITKFGDYNIKPSIESGKANQIYINQLRLQEISNQKLKKKAYRVQRIIDIFLYTTLTSCFIFVICLLMKILL